MRRWYETVSLVWGVCGVLLIGCGPIEMEALGEHGQYESSDSACLNCNQNEDNEEEHDLTPSSSVRAFPEELMFFGDFQQNQEMEGAVSVQNLTHSAVLITAVYVVGDTSMYGNGAEEYFHTDWTNQNDNLLEPGETLEISVKFEPSHQLRSAGLFIETTHVDFGLLDVDLSGKIFGDN